MNRLIIAMTGATGAIYGVRALEMLKGAGVETHLVMSKWAAATLLHETAYSVDQVNALASAVHPIGDLGATIASGSFVTMGMLIVPCSMRTLGAVANGIGDNLIHRAADVVLKERRRLVLAVQETPVSAIHLENMLKLSRLDVQIVPPVPAFYTKPASIDDVVNYTVTRMLDQVGITLSSDARWAGFGDAKPHGTTR
ncbi:MAG TPA: UbiX family flavin prenyltransferase [Vicinamibacterales bacterium]|nr:UbiX family flavin prenyltransferase [Vicinamibacterales bacterium]